MTAAIEECTSEEQSAVIRFLWSEGVSAAEIYRRFLNSARPKTSVFEKIEKLKKWPDKRGP